MDNGFGLRPTPKGGAVAKLPRRTAHAVHALLEASRELNMPVTSREIVIYDEEARDARSTGAALREANRGGWAVFTGRYWVPTSAATDRRREFEDRYLSDTVLPAVAKRRP